MNHAFFFQASVSVLTDDTTKIITIISLQTKPDPNLAKRVWYGQPHFSSWLPQLWLRPTAWARSIIKKAFGFVAPAKKYIKVMPFILTY